MAEVHNRMPVVVPKTRIRDWICDLGKTEELLAGGQPGLVKRAAE